MQILLAMFLSTASAEADFDRLHPREADATSYLRSNWNKYTENYHPTYVLDDDPKTAWVEGVDGQGEGSVLTMRTSVLKSARSVRVRVRNGYQKSRGLLQANSAPKEVTLTVLDAAGQSATSLDVTLKREMGWQEFQLELPEGASMSGLSLTVQSVHPGTKYKDTCVSDLQVLVDSDIPYNATQEQAAKAKTDAWISERVARAAYFASQPPEFPFRATDYRVEERVELDKASSTAELGEFPARMAALREAKDWRKATRKRAFLGTPEQLQLELGGIADLLLAGNVAFFETDEPLALHEKNQELDGAAWTEERWRSNARVRKVEGQPHDTEIYFWTKLLEDGRTIWEKHAQQLVMLDSEGRVTTLYTEVRLFNEIGPRQIRRLVRMPRDSEGQIAEVDVIRQAWYENEAELRTWISGDVGPVYDRVVYTPAP